MIILAASMRRLAAQGSACMLISFMQPLWADEPASNPSTGSAGSAGSAGAAAPAALVTWPADWQVQVLPAVQDSKGQAVPGLRERALKTNASGDTVMVIELTQSQLQPGHQVKLDSVLMEMRKSIQVNFAHGGYQSACTRFRETTLSRLPALQTTCQISLNGGHVMTQTLVAAVGKTSAYAFAYAGNPEQYEAASQAIDSVRDSLNLE